MFKTYKPQYHSNDFLQSAPKVYCVVALHLGREQIVFTLFCILCDVSLAVSGSDTNDTIHIKTAPETLLRSSFITIFYSLGKTTNPMMQDYLICKRPSPTAVELLSYRW